MSKNEKLHKLANAIREYRGARSEAHGKWIRPPNPAARGRVERWLGELGLDVAGSMARIDAFETAGEFQAWVAKL